MLFQIKMNSMNYQEKLKQYEQKDYQKIWSINLVFLFEQNIFL